MTGAPVELTVRYATSVPDLPQAWAFVMAHIDRVGDDPDISITPEWVFDEHSNARRLFGVSVSGTTEEQP